MHAETRARVDLADSPARIAVGLADVARQEIDTAYIQADRIDSANRHLAIIRVHHVGHVDGRAAGRQIGRRTQVDDLALLRHCAAIVVFLREQAFRLVIKLQASQYFFVTDTATRILVHDVNEFLNRVLAVADDMPGYTLGGGNEFAVDDKQAVVEAVEEGLDDYGAMVLPRFIKRDLDFLGCLEVD